MSGGLTIPLDTQQRQSRASDPRASAWVSANAGSGKTFVLSRRVVRLLLDGVDPSTILSLTFTKAAAANMANKVFEILGGWVALDDGDLARQLAEIDGVAPSPERMATARRLFARAVETPGGLKIQTIHAFCERLLHLFPFEANVSAAFEVLDDAGAAEMLAEARHGLLTAAAAHPGGEDARALAAVEAVAGQAGFDPLMAQALDLRSWLRRQMRDRNALRAYRSQLAEALGVAPDETAEDVARTIVEGGIPSSEWPSLAATLDGFAPTDRKQADLLRAAAAADVVTAAGLYATIFLTAEDQPRRTVVTQGVKRAHPDLAVRLDAEQARVEGLVKRRKAVDTLGNTMSLLHLAEAISRRYERAKSARGLLDFDDLVSRTLALLSRADAAWVLYKLDQGIEHILVDEAQDTSQAQWDILQRIADEFTAGQGSNPRVRTVFAVGDAKQSIFSFQGADPEAFESTRRRFNSRFADLRAAAEDPLRWRFEDVRLHLSFRSAQDILDAVDAVFREPSNFHGLSSDADASGTIHASARAQAPGRVEIWPLETPGTAVEQDAWAKPLDMPDEAAPPVRLARRIAAQIHNWGTTGDETGRLIRPGDVLILVRSRGAFFESMIRALKQRNVPVAGADRLALTTHIAVMDLIALGRASLLPQDDLALACVLRSPLFGLDETALFDLAADRPDTLAAAVAARAARGEPKWAAIQGRLEHWRKLARRAGPFAFYAAVLGPGAGRLGMLGRLGSEAGDAVDEFLRLALDHEQRRVPSLSQFLNAVEAADITVRRDMEAGRDEVRVMTVHGAKGLEAPVVFLADTCTVPRNDARILSLGDDRGRSVPVWSRSKGSDPSAVTKARDAEAGRIRGEYNRLLYVGMTRAKDRLVICGFETKRGRGEKCWYDMVHDQLAPLSRTEPAEDGQGDVLRFQKNPFVPAAAAPRTGESRSVIARPAWLDTPVAAEPGRMATLSPSKALAAADGDPRPGDTPFLREARAAGILVHRLLELLPQLPPDRRADAARALAETRGAGLPDERRQGLVQQVLGLLDDARLQALFGPDSRAEAALAGTLPGPTAIRVSGQVDRLAFTAAEVLVADYKTTARPPPSAADVPEVYVGQLAVYRALLAELAAGRRVRCLLIYTSGPTVLEVSDAQLDAALARITAA